MQERLDNISIKSSRGRVSRTAIANISQEVDGTDEQVRGRNEISHRDTMYAGNKDDDMSASRHDSLRISRPRKTNRRLATRKSIYPSNKN